MPRHTPCVSAGFIVRLCHPVRLGVRSSRMELKRQAHSVYHLRYHLVFVTKYRRNILKGGLGKCATAVLRNVTRQYPDMEILEMNTDGDHVRLLVSIPPKVSVSDAVRLLKTSSARAMRQRFKWLGNMYEQDRMGMWSDGFLATTVGCNEAVIARYIEQQGQEDKGQAKLVW